jgi:prevent-host-death family protein
MAVTRRRRARTASRTVPATTAAKNFGALVDRVRETGVAYVIERKGRPIAEIGPVTERRCTVGDLAGWLEAHAAVPPEFTGAVTAHLGRVNRPRIPSARWGF